ncbi:MAG TPA: aspartyl protease family protein [Candidatus Eisenbacteria bacterium]|nr:aspartyl protease family protein [Candidatus Eisenbacteria bacterium]
MIASPPSLEDVLARVRQRLGVRPTRDDLVVRGRVEHLGSLGTFTWRFGPRGSFVRTVDASTKRMVGASEHRSWVAEGNAPVRDLEWGEVDEARLLAAVLSGAWLDPSSGVSASLLPEGRVRLVLGRGQGELTLDPATGEPRRIVILSSFAESTWRFSDYESFAGVVYPKLVEQDLPAGVVNRFEVVSVTREPSIPEDFEAPAGAPSARFHPGVPSEVAVERLPLPNAFLIVRPEIDGRAIGAFIFDTGAGANVISPRAALTLGLPTIGASWLGLAAGASSGTVRQAQSMQLGPITIDRPAFVEMDLDPLSAISGVEIVGIVGYDVLRRSIVEIEVAAPRLAIFDPATPQDESAPWQPIVVYRNHVYASARFEGHEGWFRLDTGAPQVPIIFNGPAVERLSLLEGRGAQEAQIEVPGGTMDVAIGEIDGFELAGHVFGPLAALFPKRSAGAFADREALGNLGQDCMAPFRARFDYRRKRAAFVKRG